MNMKSERTFLCLLLCWGSSCQLTNHPLSMEAFAHRLDSLDLIKCKLHKNKWFSLLNRECLWRTRNSSWSRVKQPKAMEASLRTSSQKAMKKPGERLRKLLVRLGEKRRAVPLQEKAKQVNWKQDTGVIDPLFIQVDMKFIQPRGDVSLGFKNYIPSPNHERNKISQHRWFNFVIS